MRILKKIVDWFVKPYLTWYLKKPRRFTYKGFKMIVYPGVFHPLYFFSTKYLFSFIEKQNLKAIAFLEIGCGSGLLSLLAYRKEANVTAIDISTASVRNTLENYSINKNGLKNNSFHVIESDVFEKVQGQPFDVIIINPPYFFKQPTSQYQHAWYCGENGDYFIKLFSQLKNYIHDNTKVYMILADNCDVERIKKIAAEYSFVFSLEEQKKIYWEVNYIFKITYQKQFV